MQSPVHFVGAPPIQNTPTFYDIDLKNYPEWVGEWFSASIIIWR